MCKQQTSSHCPISGELLHHCVEQCGFSAVHIHSPSLIQGWLLLHEGSLGIKSNNSRTDRENGRIRSQLGLYNTV